MHAVVVDVAISDQDAALRELEEQVVPQVSASPGFVAGYWIGLGGGKGTSFVVFDSESSAQAAAGRVEPPPQRAVTIERVTVGEVVAHA